MGFPGGADGNEAACNAGDVSHGFDPWVGMTPLEKVKAAAAAAAKLLQSCLTLCDPTDGSLPGSPVPGILP